MSQRPTQVKNEWTYEDLRLYTIVDSTMPVANILKLSKDKSLPESERLTDAQIEFMEALKSGLYSLLIWVGAVRRGKTAGIIFALIVMSILFYIKGIGNGNFILGAPTIGSIYRNQLSYWYDICDQLGLTFIQHRGDERYFSIGYGSEEVARFYLFGGENEGSEGPMRGITAIGGWIDETTKCVESFIRQAIFRTSNYDEAFIIMSSNTDNPYHWLMSEFIENAPSTSYIMQGFHENVHISAKRWQAVG